MSLSLIRAEYKTILQSIAGIGVVHDYARLAVDWAKFLELFKNPETEKILGWEITREASPAETIYLNRVNDRSYDILIRGYAGLQDAVGSEKVFQDLIEQICTTFRPLSKITAGGGEVRLGPLTVTLLAERMFGSVLCHYTEIRNRATERVTY